MSRATLRELARDNIARLIAVLLPLAALAQFIGHRTTTEIVFALFCIAVCAVLMIRSLHRDAASRTLERRQLAHIRRTAEPGRHRDDRAA